MSPFEKEAVKLFFSVSKSGLYKMKFHHWHHLVKDVRRFRDISVLDASAYEHLNVHIKRSYRGFSRRHARGMQNAVILM